MTSKASEESSEVIGGPFGGGERVTGIEPAFSAWEADVLPLNYTRKMAICLAGEDTSESQSVSADLG